MAAVPEPMHALIPLIYQRYERLAAEERARPYLGASILGHKCDRYLWYVFRFASQEDFSGRLLRLFDTGKREEARLIEDLRAIGCTVFDVKPDGTQYGVVFAGGHGAGHMDAVVVGLPEAPKTYHVAEFKTHNEKSFKDLQAKGVRAAKPMHYAQMIVYAGLEGLTRMLYLAVNKNTEELHAERLEFDPAEFARLMAKAERIAFASEPPPGISRDAAHWECKFCSMHAVCHGDAAPAPTCRSCAHVTPQADGTWLCEHFNRTLSIDEQRAGCPEHRFIPALLEKWADLVSPNEGQPIYRLKSTGQQFTNGAPPAAFSSAEIHACADKRALGAGNAFVAQVRAEFDARVVG